jgi:hypothetical protein
MNASIPGAEVGCQREVGVASSMAAAGSAPASAARLRANLDEIEAIGSELYDYLRDKKLVRAEKERL